MNTNSRPCDLQGHSGNQTASSAQAKPRKSGGGGAYGNRFVLSDFAKLLRWRRGHGLLDDATMRAMLDIVIPRHAQLKTTASLSAALLRWVTDHVPEIIETHGSEWVEARRVEIMSREIGSFPRMDKIAEDLKVTQEEVDGACLCSLVAFGNPEHQRAENTRKQDQARSSANRIKNGATPRSQSKARTKPWEALGMSRRTFYRKGLHEAPLADSKPIQSGTISSGTDTVAPFRPAQSINTRDAHHDGRADHGDEGMPTRTRIEVGDRDVSDDWRAFMQARRLPETVELPF